MANNQFTGVFGYMLQNWRVTFLLMIGLALAGIITAVNLPRESTPEVEIPFASVLTVYPGASARDVEELVTDEIEERVENLAGVEEVTSSSRLGVSIVSVEFSADENLDEAIRRLRESIAGVTRLPEEAEEPQVQEISFENEPILTIGLGGSEDTRLLTLYADDLADEISAIGGISSVSVVGSREQEIQVLLDPVRLAQLNLSVGQVVGVIRGGNSNIPLGQVTLDEYGYDVRIQGRFENISDVTAVTVPTASGSIPLEQLATVKLAVADVGTTSRISTSGQPSTAAVTIQVVKKTGGNIVDVVDEVKQAVATYQREQLPEGITVETFADRADEVRRSLNDLTDSGLQTLIIVFIVLWLFLGWKIALIAALGVPLTFAMSFLVFDATGVTLNGISLFSLIIALGLLVDNAIVLIEGIQRGVGRGDLRTHAMAMVRQFQKPLIGGTLTTVAAFVPMLLVSGIIGEFLRTIPIVLTATLLSSLFVALAFLPAVTVRMLQSDGQALKLRRFDGYYNRFQDWYDTMIDRMLRSRRAQNIFMASLVVLLIAGFALPFTGLLKTGLFPEANVDFILANIELPPGATLERTSAKVIEVERILQQVPDIQSYVVNIGAATSLDFGGGSSSENVASLVINLKPDREIKSVELSRQLREKFLPISGAEIDIIEISGGPPTSAAIELRVVGPDLERISTLADEIMADLRSIPGAIEVDHNLKFSAGEFTFTLDPQLVAQSGVTVNDVAGALRTYLFGSEATSFLGDEDKEVNVKVQAPPESLNSIAAIQALPIITAQGQQVLVGQVATVELNTSINTIIRRDGERAVTITANSDGSKTSAEISTELQQRIDARQLPAGYRVDFGGEQQETEETFAELYRSMIIAVILIMIIMVIEFNSYIQPFFIFLSIPFALIGVLFGLMLFGGQLNFAAFLGLVSLTGIVVNNGIVLVDRINQGRDEGMSALAAIKDAGTTRLRPVILSNLTSVLGVVPLMLVDDQFYRDLSLTLITGQLFSTVLTLVFIPVLSLRHAQWQERRQARASL